MADSEHQHGECRHCAGLCAGRAAKCPYCKRWLRRDDTESVGSAGTGAAGRSGALADATRR